MQSAARRIKMGKRLERAMREKTPQSGVDDGDKSPGLESGIDEPFKMSGNFQNDLTELCKQNSMYRPPPVVLRPKRPISSGQQNTSKKTAVEQQSAVSGRKGKEDKKQQLLMQQQQQQDEEQENPEEKEIMELLGFKPKTFTVKDSIEFLKPTVQVELDHADKYDTVNEIYVRGWKVEEDMMANFKLCFEAASRLHTLNFWRVGFTSERIKELADILEQRENIKTLNIDANDPLLEENYHLLIKEESHLSKLRLRYCHVTKVGAKLIAEQLGTVKRSNSKLVSLDLSGNKIGDEGMIHIAKALRTNRTLLSLSLCNNNIGDEGIKELAHSISRFFLTHEEIVERRMLISEKGASERAKSVSSVASRRSSYSPAVGRRRDSKDRPGSVRSGGEKEKGGKPQPPGKTPAKGKKDAKEKDEKHDKGKGKKEEKASARKESKAVKAAAPPDALKVASGKAAKGSKGSRGSRAVAPSDTAESSPEALENMNPLLERVESIEPGKLLITGNFVLIFLNLARNQITERGLEELKVAMGYQVSHLALTKVNGTGMMKLNLKSNLFPEANPIYKKLLTIMLPRDPLVKSTVRTPDSESLHG